MASTLALPATSGIYLCVLKVAQFKMTRQLVLLRLYRTIIHIGAGMWVWGVLYFFDELRWGIIPFATFMALIFPPNSDTSAHIIGAMRILS